MNDLPTQIGGDPGCICRTCGQEPAAYLDQCSACRALSTQADDMQFLDPAYLSNKAQAEAHAQADRDERRQVIHDAIQLLYRASYSSRVAESHDRYQHLRALSDSLLGPGQGYEVLT